MIFFCRRVRDKYESEITELERLTRESQHKHNVAKAQVTEMEGDVERMRVEVRQREQNIDELSAVCCFCLLLSAVCYLFILYSLS